MHNDNVCEFDLTERKEDFLHSHHTRTDPNRQTNAERLRRHRTILPRLNCRKVFLAFILQQFPSSILGAIQKIRDTFFLAIF